MSVKAISAVFESGVYNGNTLVVLLAFADAYHDEHGVTCPSNARLARFARIDKRSVRRFKRDLERDGVLVPAGDVLNLAGGRGKVTQYRLDFGRLAELGNASAAAGDPTGPTGPAGEARTAINKGGQSVPLSGKKADSQESPFGPDKGGQSVPLSSENADSGVPLSAVKGDSAESPERIEDNIYISPETGSGEIPPEIVAAFEAFWAAMPHQPGDPYIPALQTYAARIGDGGDVAHLLAAANAYRAHAETHKGWMNPVYTRRWLEEGRDMGHAVKRRSGAGVPADWSAEPRFTAGVPAAAVKQWDTLLFDLSEPGSLGRAKVQSWLAELVLVVQPAAAGAAADGGGLALAAASRFKRDYVQTHFGDRLPWPVIHDPRLLAKAKPETDPK